MIKTVLLKVWRKRLALVVDKANHVWDGQGLTVHSGELGWAVSAMAGKVMVTIAYARNGHRLA